MQDRPYWLAITDAEVSSAELVAEIERRVEKRGLELGQVHLLLPSFGPLSTFPEPPTDRSYSPALYYHLRRANQMDTGAIEPSVDDGRGMSIPLLGRFWRSARRRFHELVLFYINRAVKDERELDDHIVSTLNEMTRVIQKQQEEIENLKAQVRSLDEGQR